MVVICRVSVIFYGCIVAKGDVRRTTKSADFCEHGLVARQNRSTKSPWQRKQNLLSDIQKVG